MYIRTCKIKFSSIRTTLRNAVIAKVRAIRSEKVVVIVDVLAKAGKCCVEKIVDVGQTTNPARTG